MNIKEVKDLIHDILQSDITEFELEHTGTKVKLRRGFNPVPPLTDPTRRSACIPRPQRANPEPSSRRPDMHRRRAERKKKLLKKAFT